MVEHHVEEESTGFKAARETFEGEELETMGERFEREKEKLSVVAPPGGQAAARQHRGSSPSVMLMARRSSSATARLLGARAGSGMPRCRHSRTSALHRFEVGQRDAVERRDRALEAQRRRDLAALLGEAHRGDARPEDGMPPTLRP